MSLDRRGLKAAALALFDAVAAPHPKGHQSAYAARYVVEHGGGRMLEVMVEKADKVPLHIWCLADVADRPEVGGVPAEQRPYAPSGATPGRHSGLTPMPQLAGADLVVFTPTSLAHVGAVLDGLLAASLARP